ncbi:hypothetical protein [Gilliamella sp. wkB7]|nr:hypothetical protein [Gilliamella apicola]
MENNRYFIAYGEILYNIKLDNMLGKLLTLLVPVVGLEPTRF